MTIMTLLSRLPFRFFFWAYYLAVLLYSLAPSSGNLAKKHVSLIRLDYLIHGLVFFSFFVFYGFLLYIRKPLFYIHPMAKLFLLIFFLALSTEILQSFTPTRFFNPFDLLANCIGILLGMTGLFWFQRKLFYTSRK